MLIDDARRDIAPLANNLDRYVRLQQVSDVFPPDGMGGYAQRALHQQVVVEDRKLTRLTVVRTLS